MAKESSTARIGRVMDAALYTTSGASGRGEASRPHPENPSDSTTMPRVVGIRIRCRLEDWSVGTSQCSAIPALGSPVTARRTAARALTLRPPSMRTTHCGLILSLCLLPTSQSKAQAVAATDTSRAQQTLFTARDARLAL